MTRFKKEKSLNQIVIVSGGQTGVDRAALDAAQELGLPCGGWCPRGRLAEDGPLPTHYPLQETPVAAYSQRTLWNVRDSDATLILTQGALRGGTAFTRQESQILEKPCRVVNLTDPDPPEAIVEWMAREGIRRLNVAGPRESQAPGVYRQAQIYLKGIFRKLIES